MADDIMLKEAIQAIRSGEKERARDLLTRLIKTDPSRPDVWVWMSTVVESRRERLYCLQEAYKRDPGNANALRGLALLGAYPAGQPAPPIVPLVKRTWQPEFPEPEKKKSQPLTAGGLLFLIAWLAAGVTLVGLAYMLITAPRDQTPSALLRPAALNTQKPTATYIASNTPVVQPVTPTFTGPTPLWMFLEKTYTPTPIYINTPHPRSEAYRAGFTAFQRGDWENALIFMSQVIQNEPEAVDGYYYLGEIYRSMDDADQAIQQFDQAISIDPQFAPAYLGRARVNRQNGSSSNQVQADLEKAFSLDPGLTEAGMELALQSIRQSDPEAALAILERMAETHAANPLLYLYRAQANLELGEFEQALKDARQANRLDQTLLEGYLTLAKALQANAQSEQSLQPLEVFLRYQTEDAAAWAMAGSAYAAAERQEDAMRAFDQALLLDEDSFEAHLLRGRIYLERGEGQPALEDFFAAIEIDETSFLANLGLGQALFLLDYPGDAYLRLSRARNLAGTDAELAQVLYWRAQALEALDRRVAAGEDWLALAEIPPDLIPEEWVGEINARLTPTSTQTRAPSQTVTRKASPTGTATQAVRGTATPAKSLSVSPTKKTPAPSWTPTPTPK